MVSKCNRVKRDRSIYLSLEVNRSVPNFLKRTTCGRPLGGDEFICFLECKYGQKLKVSKKGRPKKGTAGK